MRLIGLTGGIATGKSAVVSILRQLGIPVVDSDEAAKRLSEKGGRVWQAILDNFGSGFFRPDGELDRKALGDFIFTDDAAREKLNRITHPIIKDEVRSSIDRLSKELSPDIIVVDVPLLFESGWDEFVDEIWVVSVPEELQLERLMKRDGITAEQAGRRIGSQMRLSEKCRMADRIINNSQSFEYTRQQIIELINTSISEVNK